MASQSGEWAGCPLPIQGVKLVIEPRYQFGKLHGVKLDDVDDPEFERRNFDRVGAAFDFGADGQGTIFMINSWYSRKYDAEVIVYHTGDGRSRCGIVPQTNTQDRVNFLLQTLSPIYSQAWTLEMESRAVETLGTLIAPHSLDYYRISGCFLETSKRSNLTYCFRRGRPTIVLKGTPDGMHGLVALCLHPIGYYQSTFCGVMCPTDDVIAHLVLMRGDEHLYWKSANQIPLTEPNSGL